MSGEIAARTGEGVRLTATQYELQLPVGVTRLLVELSGSGDVDLFLRQGSVVGNQGSLATYSSTSTANTETIEVLASSDPAPTPGSWYIAVGNKSSAIVNFEFVVTVEALSVDEVREITFGDPVVGSLPGGARLDSVQYTIDAQDVDSQSLDFSFTHNAVLELYVRRDAPVVLGPEGQIIADATIRAPASSFDSGTLPQFRTGTYFFAIGNRGSEIGDYTLTVTLSDATPGTPELTLLESEAPQAGQAPAAPPGTGRLDPHHYAVDVPADGSLLRFAVLSSNNVALYARRSERVAFQDGRLVADYSMNLTESGEETLEIDLLSQPPLRGGRYYLALVNFGTEAAGYTVEAFVDVQTISTNFVDMPDGEWTSVLAEGTGLDSGARLSPTQYVLAVPGNSPGIDVLTDPQAAGNVDLYMRRDRPVQVVDGLVIADHFAESSRAAEAITVFAEDVSPGTYYVALVNRSRNDVPMDLIAVFGDAVENGLSIPVETGQVIAGTLPAGTEATCILSIQQFAVEVPADTLRLQVDVYPASGGPMEILFRAGGRILIDRGDAIFDGSFSTDDVPMEFSGLDLEPDTYFFALANCTLNDQSYEFQITLDVPRGGEHELENGQLAIGIADEDPGGLGTRLHSIQYFVEVTNDTEELVIGAWGGECADEDVDLLVSRDGKVTANADGTSNAMWVSATPGSGTETVIIGADSNPPLEPGIYWAAIVNRKAARIPIRIGATAWTGRSLPLGPGVVDTIARAPDSDTTLFHDRQYYVDVPVGLEEFAAEIFSVDGNGEFSFYGRYGIPAALVDGTVLHDQTTHQPSSREWLAFPANEECLRPGRYFLSVSHKVPSEVRFGINAFLGELPCIPIALGDLVEGAQRSSSSDNVLVGPAAQYCLEVPEDSAGFQLELIPTTNRALLDLFVREDQPVEFLEKGVVSTFSSEDEAFGTEWISIPRPRVQAGTYYIAIGSRSTIGRSFELHVRSLEEIETPVSIGDTLETVVPRSSNSEFRWLSPEQFVLTVPEGTPRLVLHGRTSAPDVRLSAHVSLGTRVRIEGQQTIHDYAGSFSSVLSGQMRIDIRDPRPGEYYLAFSSAATRVQPVEVTIFDFAPDMPFLRGDADGSRRITLTDPIHILQYMFGPGELDCIEAADVDDNRRLDLADPIRLLNYLFRGPAEPAPPYPTCDANPLAGEEGEFSCESYPLCADT